MDKFSKSFDSDELKYKLKKNKRDIIFWICGICFAGIVFWLISSKDYSFLLVLSALAQMLAFLIIVLKIVKSNNTSGLSVNTLICYLFLLIARLSSTIFFTGYLPSDSSGDWFYQLTEVVSVILIIILIYFIKGKYKETSDTMIDSAKFYYLVIPTFILSIIIHTNLNSFIITDINWTFSMYLEAIAIFPQLKLFMAKRSQIESYTSHYVALCGLSKLLSLFFWVDTYPELNSMNPSFLGYFTKYSGYCIVFSQILQLVILGDYYYLYFKALFKGEKMAILGI
ncbi:MAG: ER lumen protein-retaining receptor [archaeon]|nr:ER lumen protein-retaining receptor [archaeon]